MPKWMDDCVKSVKKKNPDWSDSRAWAVCTAAYKKKFGHAPSREGGNRMDKERVLTESYKAGLVVESVEPEDSDSPFAFMVNGTVLPAPVTEHGTYSRNRRLYTPSCIEASYSKSVAFMEDNVATMYGNHMASWSDKLPLGKVVELRLDDGAIKFRGGFADTSEARDLRSLIEAGVLERVSLRASDWESHYEEIDDLGRVEVMDWFVLSGIDFAEQPGLDGTKIVKEAEEPEEADMKLSELTLAELKEERPDLIAEIVEGAAPEPIVEYQVPAETELELAILKAASTGTSSLVIEYLSDKVESVEDLTDELLQEARTDAAKQLYGRHNPAPAANLKGDGSPAPDPEDGTAEDDGEKDPPLSESQREMIELSGGQLSE